MQDISSKTKRRYYIKSSSFLMALLFTVLCGIVALTLGYFINYFAKGHFVHGTQAVIDSEIKYIEALGRIPEAGDDRIYIPLNKEGELPKTFPKPQRGLTEGLLVFNLPKEGGRYAARIHILDSGQKVLVGMDVTDMAADFHFMQLIGIASIVFVMIVVFVSYLISVFVVKGTNKIADTAFDIIRTGDLSRRVDINSRWDDLSNVAMVLNLLLDRVEELMQGVRQVSDNIAHDLRTPLTRMRSHIEEMQKRESDGEKYKDLMDEADQILETFSALLRISRIETQQQRSQFKLLALDEILQDIVDFYEPLAEAKHILISLKAEPVEYVGDRDLLFQALANILDNAIKYTPEQGMVDASLQKTGETIRISFENTGEALSETDLPKIFNRFYRADKSRTTQGTGLGLSLVTAIVSLHKGAIRAKNSEKGVCFVITLPTHQ